MGAPDSNATPVHQSVYTIVLLQIGTGGLCTYGRESRTLEKNLEAVTIEPIEPMKVSEFVFSHSGYYRVSSLLVDLFYMLVRPDLHPAITLATTVHSFHIRGLHI